MPGASISGGEHAFRDVRGRCTGGNIAFAPSGPAVIAQAYVKLYDERRDAELHYVACDR